MIRFRKILSTLLLLALLVPAALILIFGPRANETVPENRVVVDYWEKWAGAEETHMRFLVDRFNETVGKDKGIFVRYTSTSGVGQKTLVAIAGGVPPDIAGLWDSNVAQYAQMDALEPLDDLARAAGIGPRTYKPVFWNICNYHNHLYALISTPATIALYYNKKIFEENAPALRAAGLDPERAPQTLDELDRYAEVLTKVEPSGRIVRAGYLPMEPGWYITSAYLWFGGEIWDAEHQQFTLMTPKVLQSLEWINKYATRFGSQATAEFRSGMGNSDSPQNAFLSGTVAMVQHGPWLSDFIERLKPEMTRLKWSRDEEMTRTPEERRTNYAWGVAPFPGLTADQNDIAICTTDVLVIPRGAKHPKEAFEFLAFVTQQKNMEKLCQLHATHSPLTQVSESFIRTHPNPYIHVFEDLARSPHARSTPQMPIWPEVNDELSNMIQQVILQQKSPREAAQIAQDRLQVKYAEFVAKVKAREKSHAFTTEARRHGEDEEE